MKCPQCGSEEINVLESRSAEDSIRRRRSCLSCDYRFTTYERLEGSVPMLVKKDGRREPFERSKVMAGLRKACEKRPVSVETLEQMLTRVEQRLNQTEEQEVPSRLVGELVMNELREVDKVAYVRFASVYREFSDVNQFMETLEGLVELKGGCAKGAAPGADLQEKN